MPIDLTTHRFVVGQQYRILLRQMGRKSKNPWVAAEFAHGDGKVKHEVKGADGNQYLVVISPEVVGTLVFRIDESKLTANGPVVQATLFLLF